MVRRSGSSQRAAERYFPVRVRIAVPECGLGVALDAMQAWLMGEFGRRRYWVGSEAGPGMRDAVLIYFLDVASAQAFVERFGGDALVIAPDPHMKPPP